MNTNVSEFKVRLIREGSREQILRIYRQAGWCSEDEPGDFIEDILETSFCFAAAFDGAGNIIGIGRALSDGCSDAYIQDVAVLKEYRGQGIGRKIVCVIIEFLLKSGIDWIGLVAEPGSEAFYEKLGFSPMDKYTPMKFSRNKNT